MRRHLKKIESTLKIPARRHQLLYCNNIRIKYGILPACGLPSQGKYNSPSHTTRTRTQLTLASAINFQLYHVKSFKVTQFLYKCPMGASDFSIIGSINLNKNGPLVPRVAHLHMTWHGGRQRSRRRSRQPAFPPTDNSSPFAQTAQTSSRSAHESTSSR